MNIEQQNKILWGIACVALFTVVVLGITVVYNEGVEKKELVDKVEFLEHELATERLYNEWEEASLDYMAYAVENYTFRGKTFEEGSECAQYFIDYQTSKPYDIWVKAPALMKFDKTCDPQVP